MNTATTPSTRFGATRHGPRRVLVACLVLPLTVLAGWISFDFGSRIGGAWMGVVAACNGALICGSMIDALADRLWPRRREGGA